MAIALRPDGPGNGSVSRNKNSASTLIRLSGLELQSEPLNGLVLRCPGTNMVSLILAFALGVSALTWAGAGASATAAVPPADEALLSVSLGITQIVPGKKDREIIWNRRLHGERCLSRADSCRYYHDGYYYETPWWTAPLFIGNDTQTTI